MLTKIYELDEFNFFVREIEFNKMDPLPTKAALTPPPVLTGTQVARYSTNGTWQVLPSMPDMRPELLQATLGELTQRRLDEFAASKGYDNILSAVSYATSTNSKFKAEGMYALQARDATWTKLYEVLDSAAKKTIPPIKSYETDVVPLLPKLEWPI
jgi:hypothetical protein